MRPFDIVEGEGLLGLMKELQLNFKVPAGKYLKKKTLEKYEVGVATARSRLSKIDTICLILDIWIETMNERGFLGVTAHFQQNGEMCMLYLATHILNERHTAE